MRGGEEGRSGEAEMQKNAVIAFGFGSLYVYFSCAAPWAPVHYMRFCGSLISSHINTQQNIFAESFLNYHSSVRKKKKTESSTKYTRSTTFTNI